MTGKFPAQMASDGEDVSIWLRHHDDTTAVRDGQTEHIRKTAVFICDKAMGHFTT